MITPNMPEDFSRRRLYPGDILVPKLSTLGQYRFLPNTGEGHIVIFRPKENVSVERQGQVANSWARLGIEYIGSTGPNDIGVIVAVDPDWYGRDGFVWALFPRGFGLVNAGAFFRIPGKRGRKKVAV